MRIGLTGGIGTGKSTVGRVLRDCGAVLIDADLVGHRILERPDIRDRVAEVFGAGVLDERGAVDRGKLGPLVFADQTRRKALEAIVHPPMIREIDDLARRAEPDGVVVIEAAILFEAGMAALVDQVWVTHCSEKTQIERLSGRDGMSREEALQRIRAQMPAARRLALADEIIDTERPKDETKQDVVRRFREIGDCRHDKED